MNDLRQRLNYLIDALSAGLIERSLPVRLALLAALAGEHLLLIGPPGTAKSELARRLHKAFADASYFERLLTRFSVPEELFGPLSITALEDDRYERHTDGYLPSASIAFIDEVFKANSAILNALLTLLNEREFDNGARRMPSPLLCAIGATNEVPEDDVLAAFYDRFLLRLKVGQISRAAFPTLLVEIDAPLAALPSGVQLTRGDLAELARQVATVPIGAEALALLGDLRDFLAAAGIYVSDRRWRKIARLLRTAALTDGRAEVSVWDCWLAQFCAMQRPEQIAQIGDWYCQRLGVFAALSPERFTRVVDGFAAQLELEQNANELRYDRDGKLSMLGDLPDSKAGEAAPRLPVFAQRRRYGRRHIAARVRQVRELIAEVDAYLARLDATIAEVDTSVSRHLWIAPDFAPTALARLAETRTAVGGLRERLEQLGAGFAALPGLGREESPEADREPEPMASA